MVVVICSIYGGLIVSDSACFAVSLLLIRLSIRMTVASCFNSFDLPILPFWFNLILIQQACRGSRLC